MSEERADDMVWKAFVATAKEVAPNLGEDFLRQAYEIQKRHQFSRDRAESLLLMDRLVEAELGATE